MTSCPGAEGDRAHAGVATVKVLGVGAVLSLLLACTDGPRAGVDFPSPWPRPVFTLTDKDGAAVDFQELTRGHPTLVLFGFASCPDVCPGHMASIAGAARQLPEADRARLRVVFITADPERDTPERLSTWLQGFDSGFVGLSGSVDQLAQAAGAMLVPAPMRYTDSVGRIVVVHYERVLGITSDDSVRVLVPAGVGIEAWAGELRRLVRIRSRHRASSRGRMR